MRIKITYEANVIRQDGVQPTFEEARAQAERIIAKLGRPGDGVEATGQQLKLARNEDGTPTVVIEPGVVCSAGGDPCGLCDASGECLAAADAEAFGQ